MNVQLPPLHVDTPQQQRALRSNSAARKVRAKFPRGTRVEATNDMGATGSGRFGTVANHLPGLSADGGTVIVLWDSNPITGKPVTGLLHASGLRVAN